MQRTATLLFVRHAKADCRSGGRDLMCGGRFDAPLSCEGLEEVKSLRERLNGRSGFSAMYSSPMQRALNTASAAPESIHRCLRVMHSLKEIDCGEADGMSIDDVRLRYPDLWSRNEAQTDENFSWPRGETYRRFRRRVMRGVNAIASAHAGERVLIVTHAGVINQVLGSILGQSAARWEYPRPRNASITRVRWSPSGSVVECFDDCSHLEET